MRQPENDTAKNASVPGGKVTDSQPPPRRDPPGGPIRGETDRDRTGRRIAGFAKTVACVLLLGFVAIFIAKSLHQRRLAEDAAARASAVPPVDVVTVKPAPAASSLTLPGQTAAWFESTIYARIDGYVGSWKADIGDTVRKGDVLAAIETPDLDAQLAAAEAKLAAAEAQVRVRQANVEFATTSYERWRDSPKGVVSEQEREAKKADFSAASAQLAEAQAQAALDKAEVERCRVLTQFKQVAAPFDGRVIERRIDIGNLVSAGSSSAMTPLYRIAQTDPLRIFVDVPQSAAAGVGPGVAAQIRVSALPGKVFSGKVARTADALDPHARTLRTEVDLENPGLTLMPGMYVEADFAIPSVGLVEVPAAALVFRPEGPAVAIVGKGDVVEFRAVHIARDDGVTVDLDSGVTAGDKAVLNIGNQIAPGDQVEARPGDQAGARRDGKVGTRRDADEAQETGKNDKTPGK
jgi:RND family efflux transporter MFP subunit